VIFFGTVGTGKDHLAAALLYAATDAGCLCRYTNGRELFARFRATMGDDAAENERKLVDDFAAPAVLAISDPTPPGSDMTAWQHDVLYRIVDRRYSLMRSTWITANLTRETADAALTEPVWDRLQQGAEVFVCDWGSYRERKQ
jgi:DNA replication protein DnaC